MTVISRAKAFVVVGRGDSYFFVFKEVKSGRSSTLSSTMADSTKRNLRENQKKDSPLRDSIFKHFFYNNFVNQLLRPNSSQFSICAKMSINFCGYTRYIIPGQEDSTLNQEPWSPAQQSSPGCFLVWHETCGDGHVKIWISTFLWILQMSSCSFLISSSYRGWRNVFARH